MGEAVFCRLGVAGLSDGSLTHIWLGWGRRDRRSLRVRRRPRTISIRSTRCRTPTVIWSRRYRCSTRFTTTSRRWPPARRAPRRWCSSSRALSMVRVWRAISVLCRDDNNRCLVCEEMGWKASWVHAHVHVKPSHPFNPVFPVWVE